MKKSIFFLLLLVILIGSVNATAMLVQVQTTAPVNSIDQPNQPSQYQIVAVQAEIVAVIMYRENFTPFAPLPHPNYILEQTHGELNVYVPAQLYEYDPVTNFDVEKDVTMVTIILKYNNIVKSNTFVFNAGTTTWDVHFD